MGRSLSFIRPGAAGSFATMDKFLSPAGFVIDDFIRARHEARVLRHRMTAHEGALDQVGGSARTYTTARQLVQVYDGGSMPSEAERIYFTYPALLAGAEAEGETGSFDVDEATTIPVVVLGHAPSVGDLLVAYAVGGRWVTERSSFTGVGSITCAPCDIPTEDLTISWTNLLSGNGSAPMNYATGLNAWTTECVDSGLQFRLSCTAGEIELRVFFFVTGFCPTGQSDFCSSRRSAPLALVPSGYTCSPFSLTFAVTEAGCPTIYEIGNTQFVITL